MQICKIFIFFGSRTYHKLSKTKPNQRVLDHAPAHASFPSCAYFTLNVSILTDYLACSLHDVGRHLVLLLCLRLGSNNILGHKNSAIQTYLLFSLLLLHYDKGEEQLDGRSVRHQWNLDPGRAQIVSWFYQNILVK
jgi:hypothetical protein